MLGKWEYDSTLLATESDASVLETVRGAWPVGAVGAVGAVGDVGVGLGVSFQAPTR